MKTPFSTPRFAPPVAALLLLHGFRVAAVTFTTDTLIGVGNNAYDGMNIVISNCTLTVDGSHSFASLQVLDGGNLTHSFLTNGGSGLNLTITEDVSVTPGGRINVNGRGYTGGAGPGAGPSEGPPLSGSGAGHGGDGGQSVAFDETGLAYDSIQQPVSQGSGGGRGYGGAGGAGGGSIKLVVGGTLRVDGSVSADGANGVNSNSGGGSGGSIWLNVQSLTGTGSLSANGGAGEPGQGGGGGGGRISIQYATNAFFGTVVAHGGNGYAVGGAGTIYSVAATETTGQVLVDNGGQPGTHTPLSISEVVDLTVQGAAVISLPYFITFRNLVVASNAWLSVGKPISITVTNNATIQAGGGIIADGAGYAGGQGPGAGRADSIAYTGGGGGYGGYGAMGGALAASQPAAAASGGSFYGSLMAPVDFGSGGGSYSPHGVGGAGGGAIRLMVTGMLMLDGRISADGSPGVAEGSGGGSGGSVWLTVGTLTGGGTISANGGMGNGFGPTGGGGGGGGRIAIEYGSYLFFGAATARGSSGSGWGGAGTIYTRANSQSQLGQVLADNGGQAGTNTSWSQPGTIDLTVKGGAVVVPPSGQSFGTLLIASNGWLSVTNQVLTVAGNATVKSGGGIIADSAGNRGGSGPGAGRYVNGTSGYIGGGAGYGGYGAAGAASTSQSTVAYGGPAYGSVSAPIDLGSGGGSFSTTLMGGAGGGAIRLTVTGVLQVDGRISATGGAGVNPSGGGGSGGTISLTVGTISGSGVISANGGMGNSLGGGGSGGRIAIIYGSYDFSGFVSAYGGGGYATGGAGTIYTKASSQSSFGQVVADNGGQAGTNTTLGSISPGDVDLIVRNGAVLSPPHTQTIGTLMVASNGWVSISNQTLTVTGNATVQAGGGIIADGTGSSAGQGYGAGRYEGVGDYGLVGGGGGYGGYGASGGGTPYAYGGNTYGSATEPTAMGSGGGGPFEGGSFPLGGSGGGALRLAVAGTLQVDGRISARGLAGSGPSTGGGSGGSIYLSVGTLTGSGAISANGGAGNYLGGGGGGGRIAITATTANTFSGLLTAYGGAGYTAGGAGTIYTAPYPILPTRTSALVVVDNGGQAGTNTSWPSQINADLAVRGGAVLASSTSQTVGNLIVGSNGWVVITASQSAVPTLTITGNATVQAGGGIIADGTGYPAGQGQGAGRYASTTTGYVGSGGGYGGNGGGSGGSVATVGGNNYGSATQPTLAGSGAGSYSTTLYGGAGGGGVRLNVTGTLLVDGRISAAGGAAMSPNFGGGSGGSVWLTAATLAGAGIISANGGAGNGLGGGGGGGRIALQYSTSVFSGVLSAYGGNGYVCGGAGTIYTKARDQNWGQLLVDNGGQAGTNTSWTGTGTVDLTVRGGAVVALPGGQSIGNLLVASNGWMTLSTQPLTVTSNATVQAGGGIIADGTGNPSGGGSGAGKSAYSTSYGYVGGGGGYGGFGATSAGTMPGLGGSTYGSATNPLDLGSGGGGSSSTAPGGAGGGAIRMNVTGLLLVNGRVSANGGAGVGQGAGGGSGGTVWLMAGTLAGAGAISANGGVGNQLGGGGGGGRISLQYGVNAFAGTINAYGGGGYAWGGAGTIYTKANNQAMGQMLVDNGGHYGTTTPLDYLSPFDLTVRGGAIAYPSSQYLLLSNLFIGAGGIFTCSKLQTNLDVAVLHNATIDTNGIATLDGAGFAAGAGPGAGISSNSIGSGAGYGGNGGASSVLPGGKTYGSAQQPVDRGSSGGLGWGGWIAGSEGGGAVRFTVGGSLTLNGRLSADGHAGLQNDAGGGSGGSIWLTAGALAGTGTIAADGGAGELYQGGGGGGGRIAIYSSLNAFDGLLSAAGAAGAAPGQAGSIYHAATLVAPQVVSSTPVGSLTAAISNAQIVFSTWMNTNSVSAHIGLTAPGGLAVNNLAVVALSPYIFQINFPQQTAQGDYALTVGPQVQDIFGKPMSQVYTSTFSIVWAVVQGSVNDTNGQPVSGVLLQPDGGVPATNTDTSGTYVLSVPPLGTVNVVPSKANLMFVPSSRTYANVTTSISNQNYLAVSTVAPALTTQVQTNTYILNWYGISGVTYQTLYSTNLVDWLPYDAPLPGTNGPLQLLVPMGTDPSMFFRVGASY